MTPFTDLLWTEAMQLSMGQWIWDVVVGKLMNHLVQDKNHNHLYCRNFHYIDTLKITKYKIPQHLISTIHVKFNSKLATTGLVIGEIYEAMKVYFKK